MSSSSLSAGEKVPPTLTRTDEKDSTAKEKSVVVGANVPEKFPASISKDAKHYCPKESAGKEILASTRKESVVQLQYAREKFVTLRSNDDQEFTVKESIAFRSPVIKNMAKQGGTSSAIHLPKVNGRTLATVLECLHMKYGDSEGSAEDNRKYGTEDLARKELNELLDVWCATLDLEIKDLPEMFYKAGCDNIAKIELPDPPPLSDMENYLLLQDDKDDISTEYSSDFDDWTSGKHLL